MTPPASTPVTPPAAAASSHVPAEAHGTAGGPASLSRLLHKYDTIAELRAARARGEPIPEKAVFKTLAEELPGALHELDRLPLPEIESRRAALRGALAGGPVAPWMTAMASYHALYRAALFVKARLAKASVPDPAAASALARAASRHASIEVGASFVQAVARPPGGRIGAVVLAEVASHEGAAEPDLLRALFPTRRNFASATPSPRAAFPGDDGSPPPRDDGSPPPRDDGSPPPRDDGSPPHSDGGSPPPRDDGSPPHSDGGSPPHRDGGSPLHGDDGSPSHRAENENEIGHGHGHENENENG